VAHQFVDEFTNKKLLIYGDGYQQDMQELIDPDCLEQRYGGNLPNVESNFWPPQFNP